MRLLVLLLITGCHFSIRGLALAEDAGVEDLSGNIDDLAIVDDLSAVEDLAAPDLAMPDLAMPDLGPPPDLEMPDLAVDPGPSSDVAENVLATWDVGESTNDTPVPCNPMNLGHITLTADNMVQAGVQALNLAYTSTAYFQAVYPKGLTANWDLRGRSSLEVWVQAIEPGGYGGWIPAGPSLVLCSPAGGYRIISPSSDMLGSTSGGYAQLLIPLSTAGLWTATDMNGFDLSHVTGLELHFDPQCGTCTVSSVTVRVDNVFFH
jgi:hypothetical protein